MRLLPGYQYCCENDTSKTFDTPVDVAYGANGKFKFKSGVTGKITFDDATFGDPIKGVIKSGFYRAAKNQGPSGYSFAVKEGQTVAVPSLTTVAYGANGAFSYKYNLTSDIDCTNAAFGEDPAPRVAKSCFVNPTSTPQGYDFAVNEGARVKVSGTVNVAFGANGQFVWKYNQTSDIACTRQAFKSDPLPGATKRCYTRQVSSPNPTPTPNPKPKPKPKPKQLQWRNSGSQERSHRSEPKQH